MTPKTVFERVHRILAVLTGLLFLVCLSLSVWMPSPQQPRDVVTLLAVYSLGFCLLAARAPSLASTEEPWATFVFYVGAHACLLLPFQTPDLLLTRVYLVLLVLVHVLYTLYVGWYFVAVYWPSAFPDDPDRRPGPVDAVRPLLQLFYRVNALLLCCSLATAFGIVWWFPSKTVSGLHVAVFLLVLSSGGLRISHQIRSPGSWFVLLWMEGVMIAKPLLQVVWNELEEGASLLDWTSSGEEQGTIGMALQVIGSCVASCCAVGYLILSMTLFCRWNQDIMQLPISCAEEPQGKLAFASNKK